MAARFGDKAGRKALNYPRKATFNKAAADGAASTATAETIWFAAPGKLTITGVSYLPSAALTADAANNATLTVRKRNADGTSAVTVASLVTDVAGGSWTQWVAKALALSGTLANLSLTAGQVLTLEIAKTGTGVVVPSGAWDVTYTAEL